MKYNALICFLTMSCAKGFIKEENNGGAGGTSSQSVSENSSTVSETVSETVSTSSIASTTGMLCIPGSTQLCNGPGACVGSQSCNSDGMGFGNCICDNSTSVSTTTGGGSFVCDPLNPGGICGPAKQCLPQSFGDPVCAPAGTGNFFALCSDYSQCMPGMDCVNDGTDACCLPWCRLSYNDCPNGFSCTAVVGDPTINGIVYGVCWDGLPCVL